MTQITLFAGSGKPTITAPQGDQTGFALSASNWIARIMLRLTVIRVARIVCVACLACAAPPSLAAPAAGDAYVYRLVNGYNNETVGQIRHEITGASTSQRLEVSITADRPSMGPPRIEIYTQDGQWLRHPLDNHGIPVDYDFSTALPVVQSPLTPGRSWSLRVRAMVPGEPAPRSVRVDGKVMGNERIRVPAGEFDTVKIRRTIYPGDAQFDNTETQIVEIDWYAPTLGRSVRTEVRSNWVARNCFRLCDRRGDWNVLELTEVLAPAR